jgi:hypothetical protein
VKHGEDGAVPIQLEDPARRTPPGRRLSHDDGAVWLRVWGLHKADDTMPACS